MQKLSSILLKTWKFVNGPVLEYCSRCLFTVFEVSACYGTVSTVVNCTICHCSCWLL